MENTYVSPYHMKARPVDLQSIVSQDNSPVLNHARIRLPSGNRTPSKEISKPAKQESQSRYSRWISDWISNWWGIEIICWIISALSLASIVIVLENTKNQPAPEWSFGITLNSIISILATISQMAMMKPVVECISQLKWLWFVRKQKLSVFQMLDDASRGPTGSLFLLGKIYGIHLISLGAIVTIIATAFNPFAQQVVGYPLRLRPIGVAETQQVLNYTGQGSSGVSTEQMIASIYDGLAQGNSNLSALAPSCSTGNCTWDMYSSLAICASVVDISSTIQKNACNLTDFGEFFEIAGTANPGYPCYNYTLPKQVITPITSASNIDRHQVSNATLSNTNPHTPDFMEIMSFTPSSGNISTMATAYLIYQPGLPTSINSFLPNPVAYELNLNLCVQTYNTSVTNGIVTTTAVKSEILKTELTQIPDAHDNTITYTGPSGFYGDDGENEFGISLGALSTLVVTGEANFNFACAQFIGTTGPDAFQTDCNQNFGFPFLNALQNSTDPLSTITGIWESMGISMTNTLRRGAAGGAFVKSFQGIALAPVAFVETNYLWLLLPIGLVSLTLVFLFATILKSQRLGSRVWKSSNLAMLQGLHGDLHAELGGLSSITEMEDKARDVKIRLNMEGGKAEHGVEYRLVEDKQNSYWQG